MIPSTYGSSRTAIYVMDNISRDQITSSRAEIGLFGPCPPPAPTPLGTVPVLCTFRAFSFQLHLRCSGTCRRYFGARATFQRTNASTLTNNLPPALLPFISLLLACSRAEANSFPNLARLLSLSRDPALLDQQSIGFRLRIFQVVAAVRFPKQSGHYQAVP